MSEESAIYGNPNAAQYIGIDTKTKAQVVRFIRLLFRRTEVYKLCKERAVHPTIKGPRGGKMYACACCGEAFKATEIVVDHIEEIVPIGIMQKDMTIDEYVNRLFCSIDNLQVLSEEHHKIKSKKENEMRKICKLEFKYIVYKTRNKINGKMYIGVHGTSNINDGYLGSGEALKRAVKEYGSENFTREIINVVKTEEEAYEIEKEIVTMDIVKDRMYYNLKEGGNCGAKLSEESHAKIAGNRVYATGKNHPRSKRIRCIETEEIFDCISEANIAQISRAIKDGTQAGGFHWEYLDDTELNARIIKKMKYSKRKVLCIETNKIYNSLTEAALDLGLSHGGKIGEVCRGNSKTAAGYTWEFVEVEHHKIKTKEERKK